MEKLAETVDFWDEVRLRLKVTPAPSSITEQGKQLCTALGVDESALQGLPVPHRRLERWKHTPVSGLLQGGWKQMPAAPALDGVSGEEPVPGLDAYRLVFVNGHFSMELSDLPVAEGVRCRPLKDGPEVPWMSGVHQEDWFAALHAAAAQDGMFLEVERGSKWTVRFWFII